MKICSVEGCDRVKSAKGLCNMHYQRKIKGYRGIRNGSYIVGGSSKPVSYKSDIEILTYNLLLDDLDGCWLWQGTVGIGGYGRFKASLPGVSSEYRPHRLSYILFIGDIPTGLVIDHLCEEKLCVNPFHLEAVSNAENVRRYFANKAWRESIGGEKPWPRGYCTRGHLYSEDNTAYYGMQKKKTCKKCNVIQVTEWKRRKRTIDFYIPLMIE